MSFEDRTRERRVTETVKVIVCDGAARGCAIEVDYNAFHGSGWMVVSDSVGERQQHWHFCSPACLARWAQRQGEKVVALRGEG